MRNCVLIFGFAIAFCCPAIASADDWSIDITGAAQVEETETGALKIKVTGIQYATPANPGSWRIQAILVGFDESVYTITSLISGSSQSQGTTTADFSGTPVPPQTYIARVDIEKNVGTMIPEWQSQAHDDQTIFAP